MRLDRLPGAHHVADASAAPRVRSRSGSDATLALRNAGRVPASPMRRSMFAGWGVVDPARGWDAYAGVDMRGKVAVLLASDPDFEAGRDLGFGGRALSIAGTHRQQGRRRGARRRGGGARHPRGSRVELALLAGRERRRLADLRLRPAASVAARLQRPPAPRGRGIDPQRPRFLARGAESPRPQPALPRLPPRRGDRSASPAPRAPRPSSAATCSPRSAAPRARRNM